MTRNLLFACLLLAAAAPAAAQEGYREPVCTYIPSLQYPSAVLDKSLSGDVLILVHLDEKGALSSTEVLHSDLPPLFIVEARKAAQQSRFLPARRDGKPVVSSITLPFHFSALEAPAAEPDSVEAPEPRAPHPARAQAAVEAEAEPPGDASRLGEDRPAEAEPSEVEPDAPRREQDEPAEEPGQPAPTERTPPEPAPPEAAPSNSALSLVEAKVGRNAGREGVEDETSVFDVGQRAYFWTRVDGGGAGQQVLHVWSWKGETVQIIELPLKGPDWRTWSYKTFYEGMAGEWTVEAWDESGNLLGRRKFVCRPAPSEEH